jgi:hypothetical protein
MPSIISATTTNGLSTSADNSGSLQLATNNGTTAVTITTGQNVAIGTTATTQKLWVNNGNVCVTNDYAFGFHSNPSAGGISNYYSGSDDTNYLRMVTAGTERMRINASGQVTTPAQPAFQIRGDGSPSVANNAVIPFSVALVNVGSHFNTSTYTFTAPVTGLYLFAISIRWENSNGAVSYWRPDLYINGVSNNVYTGALQATASNTYAYVGQTYVISANAGDTYKYHYNTSGGVSTNSINTGESLFSGYLLG